LDGRFALRTLPIGDIELRIERLGYRALTLTIELPSEGKNVVLRLQPEPVAISGVEASSNARRELRGVVRDALTGDPIRFASVTLTTDGITQVGRVAETQADGRFQIPPTPVGGYLVRVDRIGFVSRFVVIEHSAMADLLELELEPDERVATALARITAQLDQRRAAYARPVLAFSESRLRQAPPSGMRNFLDAFTSLDLVGCPDRLLDYKVRDAGLKKKNCIASAGDTLNPVVLIDDRRVPESRGDPSAIGALDTYNSKDFYLLEYFECAGRSGEGPFAKYIELHAYTYQYIERLTRQPRIPFPPCS
jgi:hypothetical protein